MQKKQIAETITIGNGNFSIAELIAELQEIQASHPDATIESDGLFASYTRDETDEEAAWREVTEMVMAKAYVPPATQKIAPHTYHTYHSKAALAALYG